MPPKPKFTKEEIVAAALELVSEKGLEALTARDLGKRLGSSARPIFTVFNSMEEVQEAVRAAALKRFESYAEKAMDYTPVVKQVGMQMILFASAAMLLLSNWILLSNLERKAAPSIYAPDDGFERLR